MRNRDQEALVQFHVDGLQPTFKLNRNFQIKKVITASTKQTFRKEEGDWFTSSFSVDSAIRLSSRDRYADLNITVDFSQQRAEAH
ncbi:hypothetical protein J6590_062122 [Homalodisca vitripennis]|nr:hypothetical protein J6590_062122 [Homalodisca vitripennis]